MPSIIARQQEAPNPLIVKWTPFAFIEVRARVGYKAVRKEFASSCFSENRRELEESIVEKMDWLRMYSDILHFDLQLQQNVVRKFDIRYES